MRTSFLNLLDLYLTPASSLKMSSRSDVGRLLINATSISTKIYRACSEIMVGSKSIYLASEYICAREVSAQRTVWMIFADLWLTVTDLDRPYWFHRRSDSIPRYMKFVAGSLYTTRKSERPQDVSAKSGAGCTESGNEVKIGSWPYEYSKNKLCLLIR